MSYTKELTLTTPAGLSTVSQKEGGAGQNRGRMAHGMDHLFTNDQLFNYTDGTNRAIMGNAGNFSVTFVPLISLVATFVPRIVTRIRTIRPTQTVSSRDFRNARFYTKKSLDSEFCKAVDNINVKLFPGFNDVFYICKPYERAKKKCNIKKEHYVKRDHQNVDNLRVAKIIGINDCFYMQLYTCNNGFHFDTKNRNCTTLTK